MRPPARTRLWLCGLAAAGLAPGAAAAQETTAPARPAILFNRWQEDWSVLADPRTPREPLDGLKYIPLSQSAPRTYLSLGAGLRERFEANDAASFGSGGTKAAAYVISRLELHADLRLGPRVQVFTQLQSDFAPGKASLTSVDQDRLDLEQAFVAVSQPMAGGDLRLRLGRQQIGFDLQRFVGVRDGPNIRQSYDAAWGDYERGPWRILGFYALPVQNRDRRAFDDYSSDHLTYGGARIERRIAKTAEASVALSQFTQDNARFANGRGAERRDILDLHAAGADHGLDWDVEAMGQTGRLGAKQIRAWAVGSLAGYTLVGQPWSPRLGLQVDVASGDGRGGRFGTFNPLFPNGYYVNLAGYTGYVNLIHVKPSVTLHPIPSVKLMLAAASQWRQTTADAVYTQPTIPVPGTAGKPGRYTGTYGQARIDWAAREHVAFALEAVHFAIGPAIRRAGGHDSDYLGAEIKFGW